MSNRVVRKLYGTNDLPPLNEDSDSDYEPLYMKKASSSAYLGLVVSSGSEDEKEKPVAISEEEVEVVEVKTKKKHRKKKNRNQKNSTSDSTNVLKMDEIDRSLMEVNALLGEPTVPPVKTIVPLHNPIEELMNVQHKHLNAQNELIRLFGRDTEEGNDRRDRNQRNANPMYRRVTLVPMPKSFEGDRLGLSMSVLRQEHGYTYFVFDHSAEYRKVHKLLLKSLPVGELHTVATERMTKIGHVEEYLEFANTMFYDEAFSAANRLIEYALAILQCASHSSFNLACKVRLEYKYYENRPFHVVLLKYLHLLTNKACHRTALEISKLLLRLDPSDPLGVLLVIDVLALRAREYEWLIKAIDNWTKERDAEYLFNIRYSNALAHFHVAKKTKGDYAQANMFLQMAVMCFPNVVARLLKLSGNSFFNEIVSHELFNPANEQKMSKHLRDLTILYTQLIWSRWREQPVLEWVIKNVREMINDYENNEFTRKCVKDLAAERGRLFQELPVEVKRHLHVIRPMGKLIVEADTPAVPPTRAFDPYPPEDGIDRYKYSEVTVEDDDEATTTSLLYEFFQSLQPTHPLPPQPRE